MIKDVYELVAKLGNSPEDIAKKFQVHPETVKRWRRYGFPSKYWDLAMKILPDLTLVELHNMNKKLPIGK